MNHDSFLPPLPIPPASITLLQLLLPTHPLPSLNQSPVQPSKHIHTHKHRYTPIISSNLSHHIPNPYPPTTHCFLNASNPQKNMIQRSHRKCELTKRQIRHIQHAQPPLLLQTEILPSEIIRNTSQSRHSGLDGED